MTQNLAKGISRKHAEGLESFGFSSRKLARAARRERDIARKRRKGRK